MIKASSRSTSAKSARPRSNLMAPRTPSLSLQCMPTFI